MPDYNLGRIYKLESYQTTKIYIGSTCQPLCERLAGHKSSYKRFQKQKCGLITSFELVQYDDVRITLIEYYPCDTKEQLLAREGHWIKELQCVNKRIAGRSQKEWVEQNPEYFRKRYQRIHQNSRQNTINYLA